MSVRISSPEEFFGFQLGSEGNIARWDRIVEYFNVLATQSDAIQVVNMGPSTEGHPFLLVIISSSENLANLDRLKEVNAQISDPRGVSEEKMEAMIAEGKAVICQSMSLHASEIGGTQMAPELAYDLLTRRDEEARRVLENVVFLMIPCFNPDGQIMVTDWYTKWLCKDAPHNCPCDGDPNNVPGVAPASVCGSPSHGQLWGASLHSTVL